MPRLGAQLHARAVAVLLFAWTRHGAGALRANFVIAALATAVPAMRRIALSVDAQRAAAQEAFVASYATCAGHAGRIAVGGRVAADIAAAAMLRIASQRNAAVVAEALPVATAGKLARSHTGVRTLVANIAFQAALLTVAELTVRIRANVAFATEEEQRCAEPRRESSTLLPRSHVQKLPRPLAKQAAGRHAKPTAGLGPLALRSSTSSTPEVSSAAPPTPSNTRAVSWRLSMRSTCS